MREIVFREDGRIITVEEYKITAMMVKLMVDLEILTPNVAFDLIMQGFSQQLV